MQLFWLQLSINSQVLTFYCNVSLIVMGIIPVAPFDWVGLINSRIPIEHSQVVVSN